MRMPFGKFKGRLLVDVPTDYLLWLTQVDLKPWLKYAVERELASRNRESYSRPRPEASYPPPVDISIIIQTWYRELALRFHPDRGGHPPEVMAALNHAHNRLKELAGVN